MKNTIKVQRAVHNMTQQQLAEKIGVSRQTINAMESNKYVPSTLLALKIAKLFSQAERRISRGADLIPVNAFRYHFTRRESAAFA